MQTLCLSKQSQENTTIGQLINLLSNDVNRFDMNLLFIPYLFVAPIQTIIFIYFLWEELGISCLAGISFIFFLTPVQCKWVNRYLSLNYWTIDTILMNRLYWNAIKKFEI